MFYSMLPDCALFSLFMLHVSSSSRSRDLSSSSSQVSHLRCLRGSWRARDAAEHPPTFFSYVCVSQTDRQTDDKQTDNPPTQTDSPPTQTDRQTIDRQATRRQQTTVLRPRHQTDRQTDDKQTDSPPTQTDRRQTSTLANTQTKHSTTQHNRAWVSIRPPAPPPPSLRARPLTTTCPSKCTAKTAYRETRRRRRPAH